MPKVFLSWSGPASQSVAEALRKWLPAMLQSVKPFMSTEGLRKGGRWNAELADELEQTKFGIICLTKENLEAPWVLFEAGAISKVVDESHVAPLLVGVQHSDLPKPLTQFNATTSEKEDFKRLVRSINTSSDTEAVSEELLDLSFEACWPKLEEALRAAVVNSAEAEKPQAPSRPSDELQKFDGILQELLVLARKQAQLLGSPQHFIPLELIAEVVDQRSRKGRYGLPDPDHRAWVDLSEAFEHLKKVAPIVSVPAEKEVILEAVARLRVPLRYVIRQLPLGSHWSPRLTRNFLKSSTIDTGQPSLGILDEDDDEPKTS